MPLFKPKDELSQFLVLIPVPETLSKEVMKLKKAFGLKYGTFSSEHSKPHITVCSFLLLNYRTDDAFSLFRQRIEHVPEFELQVNDFDFFDDSKVIYAKVEASDTFDFITSELNRNGQPHEQAEARITDAELLTLFSKTQQLSDDQKQTVTDLLSAFLLKANLKQQLY